MERTTITSREVTVAASELPAYIVSLPRLLTEVLTINVSGTLEAKLDIRGFYGSGALKISGGAADTDYGNTIFRGVTVAGCSIYIHFENIRFEMTEKGAALYLYHANKIYIDRCGFVGPNVQGLETFGINATNGSCVWSNNIREISGFYFAVACTSASQLTIDAGSAVLQNNAVGANARGGTIYLGYQTADLLGGTTSAKAGGLIVKGDGTLL